MHSSSPSRSVPPFSRDLVGEDPGNRSDGLELAGEVLLGGGDPAVADELASGERILLRHVLESHTHL